MSIAIFILILNIFNSLSKSIDINNETICVTDICNKTATNMKKSMNLDIDPCTDFYNYACGNWPSNEPSHYSATKKFFKHRLNEMLDAVPPSEKNTPLAKARMYYESCMNSDRIESETIADLLKIMDKNGGWPMIMSESDWMSKKKSWQEVDMAYRKLNYYSPIFSLSVKNTRDEPKIFSIKLGAESKLFYDLYRRKNKSFETYMSYPRISHAMNMIKKVSKIIASHRNYSIPEKTLEDDVKNIYEFEWKLQQGSKQYYEESSEDIDNFQSYYNSKCCKTENSKIDWLNMIRQYFEDVPNVNINGSRTINLMKDFFPWLSDLLDQTPERVIVNTIHWQFILSSYDDLNEELQTLLNFSAAQYRSQERPQECEKDRSIRFIYAISHSYVQKHFSKKVIDKSAEMVSKIVHQMNALINSSILLRNDEKLNLHTSMKTWDLIRYPDWYENKTKMDHFYDDIELSQSWLENKLAMKKFTLNWKLRFFGIDSTKIKDQTLPAADFLPEVEDLVRSSTLSILAGLMQSPLFDENLPDAINYGGLGSSIGEYIGYLVSGTDETRNKRLRLNDNINRELRKNTNCFLERFEDYLHLSDDGDSTFTTITGLSYNFVDNLRVRATYEAFQVHKKQKTEAIIRLPGLENLNDDQQFFLSFAQTHCAYEGNEDRIIPYGGKIPRQFRVNNAVSNSKNFAKAFQCAEDAPMNPFWKCYSF